MQHIVVTWMDGRQETYPADYYREADGVLHITEKHGVTGGTKNHWSIPLANVRIWKVACR